MCFVWGNIFRLFSSLNRQRNWNQIRKRMKKRKRAGNVWGFRCVSFITRNFKIKYSKLLFFQTLADVFYHIIMPRLRRINSPFYEVLIPFNSYKLMFCFCRSSEKRKKGLMQPLLCWYAFTLYYNLLPLPVDFFHVHLIFRHSCAFEEKPKKNVLSVFLKFSFPTVFQPKRALKL